MLLEESDSHFLLGLSHKDRRLWRPHYCLHILGSKLCLNNLKLQVRKLKIEIVTTVVLTTRCHNAGFTAHLTEVNNYLLGPSLAINQSTMNRNFIQLTEKKMHFCCISPALGIY
jgi:hypothetical protein